MVAAAVSVDDLSSEMPKELPSDPAAYEPAGTDIAISVEADNSVVEREIAIMDIGIGCIRPACVAAQIEPSEP